MRAPSPRPPGISAPCAEWYIHQVTSHLVGRMRIFTGELTVAPADADADVDEHPGHVQPIARGRFSTGCRTALSNICPSFHTGGRIIRGG